ncbi:MAG: thiamine phosphate synthase [Verrucomicrobiales bacterium]|nr:thiamine phosphate synthase [Verrucomicrobiales bacterium]
MKLYSILDLGYIEEEDIAIKAELICDSGISMLQLRAKNHGPERILEMAKVIRPICSKYKVPFIINDYPEIAAEVSADGVHIGQNDGKLEEARKLAGNCKIVGRSTHCPEQAQKAHEEGADYIGFGPLYPTATKPGRPAIGLNEIALVHDEVPLPIFCIGGITEQTLPEVLSAGAQNVVIVSNLLQSEDIKSYVLRIQRIGKNNSDQKS